jgi:multiple sugar transport system permease protein
MTEQNAAPVQASSRTGAAPYPGGGIGVVRRALRHPLVRVVVAVAIVAIAVVALVALGWVLLAFLIVPSLEVVTVSVIGSAALVITVVVVLVVRSNRTAALTRMDKLTLGLMTGIPTALIVMFILVPMVASLTLSLTSWNGIGGFERIQWIGLKNYVDLHEVYKPFYPAISHNAIWLLFFIVVATPLGMFFAVLLDKNIRGTRFYQSALYLPVVLSLAIVGFIWILIYAPEQGLINNLLGTNRQGNLVSWLGDPSLNLWAVLVAATWRHVGYVMVLYLAGLKAVDPTLKEAAAIDGASERQTFFQVVFPVLKPINIVIIVITVIESLRAFDLAFIINKGLNGLELLSTLVTNNIIGETARIGFGSAIAMVLFVLSVVPIVIYLSRALREDGA